ncbi:methyltransferase [Auraticoccus sp. F435]|uniref:Methyltransferase n=1 Tax=Auraticoccus cholistanensis TaxID=2656650 RepID=A0A6A9UVG0_9ACTN|nr:methyltransferase [Auraticoccus cholistanensis]MVA76946.1 methyltransferase [Auraticoccus cholistanensis]
MVPRPEVIRPPLEEVDRLRDRFLEVGWRTDDVLGLIGAAGQAGLGRNSTVPAERALAGDRSPLATLTRLWLLQREVAEADLRRALGPSTDDLLAAGLLGLDGDRARALVDVRPYGSEDDGASGWLVSDLTPGLDQQVAPMRPDYVLGASPASTTLAQLTIRRPVGRALDLGTGCGVQSLHLSRHADSVVATDLNPRALSLAALTLRLSGARTPAGEEVQLRAGDLYQPVAGERFDLVVTNPPYVMAPPSGSGERLVYREGALPGDELVRRVVTEGAALLADGGTCQVLANWAHVAGEPWQERLAGWVEGTGCDLLVLQREVLDPAEYVELWLADAGLTRDPAYRDRCDQWLDYFEALGIEAVGMGWISVHRAGRDVPQVRTLDWPHAVEQPVGPAFARQQQGLTLSLLPEEELLLRRWALAPDVVQETVGAPGAADPEHIVLRQQTGFRSALRVDTAVAGVLGACDGELALGVVLDAVASLLEQDPVATRAQVLPEVRRALADGLLSEPVL